MASSKLTKKDHKTIEKMYKSGSRIQEICYVLDISQTCMYGVLNRLGVKRRNSPKLTKVELSAIRKAVAKGETRTSVARRTGRSYSTILRALKEDRA